MYMREFTGLSSSSSGNGATSAFVPRKALEGWTTIIFGYDQTEVDFIRGKVFELDGVPLRILSDSQLIATARNLQYEKAILFMELKVGEDIDTFVNRCFSLREINSSMPIVLFSSRFRYDDFSTERLAICDASLRAPLLHSTFEQSIEIAIQNNQIFSLRSKSKTPLVCDSYEDSASDHMGNERFFDPLALIILLAFLSIPLWLYLLTSFL